MSRPVAFLLLILCGFPEYAQADAAAPTPDAHAENLRVELARVEHRLAEVDAERARHPLTGPIGLMAGGFAVAGILDIATFTYWFGLQIKYVDYEEEIDASHKRRMRQMAGLSLLGLAAGVSGAIWFRRRLHARRALAPERRRLLERRRELTKAVQLVAITDSAHLQIAWTF
jgi:hypothetical protein